MGWARGGIYHRLVTLIEKRKTNTGGRKFHGHPAGRLVDVPIWTVGQAAGRPIRQLAGVWGNAAGWPAIPMGWLAGKSIG